MRDFKGVKRQRSRNRNLGSGGSGGGGGARPQQHNANRAFDSNGPEGTKVRGAAQHVYEKYQQLARDAQTAGDRVLAENYLQHAEHYFRLLRAMQPLRPLSEIIGRDQFVSGYDIDFEDESGAEAAAEAEAFQEQPVEATDADRAPRVENRVERQNDNRQGDNRQGDNRPNDNRPNDNRQNERQGEYRRDDRVREDRYQADRSQADRSQNDRLQNDRYQGDRPNDRYQGDRQNDRYQGDRTQGDRAQGGQDRQQGERQRNDRPRDDRQRDDRPRDDRQREGQRPYREDRPRYEDRARDDRARDDRAREEPVRERVDAESVAAAPTFTPYDSQPQPIVETQEPAGMLRADDGEVSAAPAFLQVRATEGEEVRKPRRRRTPASFEPSSEVAPEGPSEE